MDSAEGVVDDPIDVTYYDVTDIEVPIKREHPVGNRRRKTAPTLEAILDGLRMGLTRRAAAGSVAIAYETLGEWMHDDPAFRAQVEQAESVAEARATRVVTEAMHEDWKAAQWWLTKRRPKDWGSEEAAELAAITTLLAQQAGLDEEEVKEAIREAERSRRESYHLRLKAHP